MAGLASTPRPASRTVPGCPCCTAPQHIRLPQIRPTWVTFRTETAFWYLCNLKRSQGHHGPVSVPAQSNSLPATILIPNITEGHQRPLN